LRRLATQDLPSFDRAALLLDLDGTLLDIAPAPDKVVVPPGLTETLHNVRDLLGGALAVVTGRPIAQVDALLGDAPHAIAGEHGGARRHAPDAAIERPALPSPPAAWRDAAARIVAAHPGALLEHKERGFVLHYRAAPDHGPALREAVEALTASSTDFLIMAAHMAWEVRPCGTDKGRALRSLMDRPPFAGRLPVFVGDDVTDEDAISAARALGGTGFRVDTAFGSPGGVRAWLDAIVHARGWPAVF
jgi:trehalose 6-phosphate phosphatase